jgi:hypothetical protein
VRFLASYDNTQGSFVMAQPVYVPPSLKQQKRKHDMPRVPIGCPKKLLTLQGIGVCTHPSCESCTLQTTKEKKNGVDSENEGGTQ